MSRVNGIDLLRARGAGRNRIPGPRRRHRRRDDVGKVPTYCL